MMTKEEFLKEIEETCRRKVRQYRNNGIGSKRLSKELDYFSREEHERALYQLYIIYHLKEFCNEELVTFLAAGYGNYSYIYYLLGLTIINPLQWHFMCPRCKNVDESWYGFLGQEGRETFNFQMDLNSRGRCRYCGYEGIYNAEGQNLGFDVFINYQMRQESKGIECFVPARYMLEAHNLIEEVLFKWKDTHFSIDPVSGAFFKPKNDRHEGFCFSTLVSLQTNKYIDIFYEWQRHTDTNIEAEVNFFDLRVWMLMKYPVKEILYKTDLIPSEEILKESEASIREYWKQLVQSLELNKIPYLIKCAPPYREKKIMINDRECVFDFKSRESLFYMLQNHSFGSVRNIMDPSYLYPFIFEPDTIMNKIYPIFDTITYKQRLLDVGIPLELVEYIPKCTDLQIRGEICFYIMLHYMLLWHIVYEEESFASFWPEALGM